MRTPTLRPDVRDNPRVVALAHTRHDFACLQCGGELTWHQPDPGAPGRLLGACPRCGGWHVLGRERGRGPLAFTLIPGTAIKPVSRVAATAIARLNPEPAGPRGRRKPAVKRFVEPPPARARPTAALGPDDDTRPPHGNRQGLAGACVVHEPPTDGASCRRLTAWSAPPSRR